MQHKFCEPVFESISNQMEAIKKTFGCFYGDFYDDDGIVPGNRIVKIFDEGQIILLKNPRGGNKLEGLLSIPWTQLPFSNYSHAVKFLIEKLSCKISLPYICNELPLDLFSQKVRIIREWEIKKQYLDTLRKSGTVYLIPCIPHIVYQYEDYEKGYRFRGESLGAFEVLLALLINPKLISLALEKKWAIQLDGDFLFFSHQQSQNVPILEFEEHSFSIKKGVWVNKNEEGRKI